MAMLDNFRAAREALMTKPDGDDTETCASCRGKGCNTCNGWGWNDAPGWCLLPSSGNPCGDCSQRKGCRR